MATDIPITMSGSTADHRDPTTLDILVSSHSLSLSTYSNKLTLVHFVFIVLTDIDISACDSGLGTPSSTTQRPSSCRDVYRPHLQNGMRDSTDTGVSSSRGTLHASPGGSFRLNGNINGLR